VRGKRKETKDAIQRRGAGNEKKKNSKQPKRRHIKDGDP